MIFDGSGADRKFPGDLFIGATLRHERQDFALTRRERGQRPRPLVLPQKAGEAVEHRGDNVRLTMQPALNRVDQSTVQLVGGARSASC